MRISFVSHHLAVHNVDEVAKEEGVAVDTGVAPPGDDCRVFRHLGNLNPSLPAGEVFIALQCNRFIGKLSHQCIGVKVFQRGAKMKGRIRFLRYEKKTYARCG